MTDYPLQSSRSCVSLCCYIACAKLSFDYVVNDGICKLHHFIMPFLIILHSILTCPPDPLTRQGPCIIQNYRSIVCSFYANKYERGTRWTHQQLLILLILSSLFVFVVQRWHLDYAPSVLLLMKLLVCNSQFGKMCIAVSLLTLSVIYRIAMQHK